MTHSAVRKRYAALTPRRRDDRPAAERLLSALGVEPAMAEVVLGDMAEERARREGMKGAAAARRWYALELVRSVPSLAWYALRHRGPEARLRLAAWITAGAATVTLAAFLLSLREGSPARLVAEGHALADGVVVNHERGRVQLPLRVLDETGRSLPTTGVRYSWMSGAPVIVSPDGAISCPGTGDGVVRASLGGLTTDVRILCRPVSRLLVEQEVGLVAGGPAHDVAFLASDSTGNPVTALTGVLSIRDTSVAALQVTGGRYRVHPRAAGSTRLDVMIGDEHGAADLTVYAPVTTFEWLGADRKWAAVAVRLAPGETRRWRVPPGTYTIDALPARAADPVPDLAVIGANCLPMHEHRTTCASGSGFWVIAYSPWDAASTSTRVGHVALARRD